MGWVFEISDARAHDRQKYMIDSMFRAAHILPILYEWGFIHSDARPSQCTFPLIPCPKMLVLLAKRNTFMLFYIFFRCCVLIIKNILRRSAKPNYQNLESQILGKVDIHAFNHLFGSGPPTKYMCVSGFRLKKKNRYGRSE